MIVYHSIITYISRLLLFPEHAASPPDDDGPPQKRVYIYIYIHVTNIYIYTYMHVCMYIYIYIYYTDDEASRKGGPAASSD